MLLGRNETEDGLPARHRDVAQSYQDNPLISLHAGSES